MDQVRDGLCRCGLPDIVEIEKIESDGKITVVPSQSQGKEAGPFDKSAFTYNADQDCYLCPEGRAAPDLSGPEGLFFKEKAP